MEVAAHFCRCKGYIRDDDYDYDYDHDDDRRLRYKRKPIAVDGSRLSSHVGVIVGDYYSDELVGVLPPY
jgi:hypothetical protein